MWGQGKGLGMLLGLCRHLCQSGGSSLALSTVIREAVLNLDCGRRAAWKATGRPTACKRLKQVVMATSETELRSRCLQGSPNILINGNGGWGLKTYVTPLHLIGPWLYFLWNYNPASIGVEIPSHHDPSLYHFREDRRSGPEGTQRDGSCSFHLVRPLVHCWLAGIGTNWRPACVLGPLSLSLTEGQIFYGRQGESCFYGRCHTWRQQIIEALIPQGGRTFVICLHKPVLRLELWTVDSLVKCSSQLFSRYLWIFLSVFHTLIPFSGLFFFFPLSLIAWKLSVDVSTSLVLSEKCYINVSTVMMTHIVPVTNLGLWKTSQRAWLNLFPQNSTSPFCMVAVWGCVKPVLSLGTTSKPMPSGRFICWELPEPSLLPWYPGRRANCLPLITTWIFHGNHKPHISVGN